jgi:hypothetical protein
MVFIFNIFRKREMIDTIFLSGSLVLVVQGIANNVLGLVGIDRDYPNNPFSSGNCY